MAAHAPSAVTRKSYTTAKCQSCGIRIKFTADATAQQLEQGLHDLNDSVFATADAASSSAAGRASNAAAACDAPPLAESYIDVGAASVFQHRTARAAGARAGERAKHAAATRQRGAGEVLQRIFEVVSAATDVPYPCCSDCQSSIKREMQHESEQVELEIQAYRKALTVLEQHENNAASSNAVALPHESRAHATHADDEQQCSEATQRDDAAARDEEQLRSELAELQLATREEEARHAALQEQLAAAQRELQQLEVLTAEVDDYEATYWKTFNALQYDMHSHMQDRDALLSKISWAETQLTKLQRINVLNDVFHIHYDNQIATINGLRLGRLPTVAVDWDEINAAWGHAVMLLHVLAQCRGFTFRGMVLMPMGSQPRIKHRDLMLPLYGPVNWLNCGSYDRAMVCFLACINQFAEFARNYDENHAAAVGPYSLPYVIDTDRGQINGTRQWHSIKRYSTLNSDAKWTHALKLMMVDLKSLLVWHIARTSQDAAAAQKEQNVAA